MKEKMLSFGKGEDAVKVAITVSSYKVGERLYVGLFSMGDVGLEPFSNLTINLPYNPAGVNEGYIERNDCKNLMEFIERHKLGRILPEKGIPDTPSMQRQPSIWIGWQNMTRQEWRNTEACMESKGENKRRKRIGQIRFTRQLERIGHRREREDWSDNIWK